MRPRFLAIASLLLVLSPELIVADDQADLAAKLAPFYQPPAEFVGKFGPWRSPLLTDDGKKVTTADEWKTQREKLLAAWHERLGGPWPELIEKPVVKRLESVQRDGHTEHRLQVQVFLDDKPLQEMYLLVPDGDGPFPAVLVTFYEPMTSLSRGEVGQGSHDYGLQLVKRGLVTLSLGTPGSKDLKSGKDTREALVALGIERQRQPLSLLAYVAANCHTALAQMPEVRPDRIGVIGLSYGGKWSMFASCLYDKFACAVWSDPGIVFNEANRNVNYWEPWYLGYEPGVQRKPGVPSDDNPRTGLYKRMVENKDDLITLHALMAPRPVLDSGGTEDPPANWQALNHLVAVNKLLGYENRVAMTARETHRPTPEALAIEIAFLEYWLKHGLDGK